MSAKGVYFTALGAGTLLFWSGFKGWGVVSTLQDIVTGKQPSEAAVNAPVNVLTAQAVGGATAVIGSASGAPGVSGGLGSIQGDAMQYQGHAYRYGGAPGKNGTQPWDCSSFCNWVISHDLGLPWPGTGRYDGTSHGPPTGVWATWIRAKGKNVKGQITQPGDVIVWANHMGIAIGSGQMISALNPSLGTKVTPVQGYGSGPLLAIGRY